MIPGYAKLKHAAEYVGMGDQTIKKWINDGMEFIKLPSGTILVKLADIDNYLDQFKVKKTKNNANDVDTIVDDVLSSFNV